MGSPDTLQSNGHLFPEALGVSVRSSGSVGDIGLRNSTADVTSSFYLSLSQALDYNADASWVDRRWQGPTLCCCCRRHCCSCCCCCCSCCCCCCCCCCGCCCCCCCCCWCCGCCSCCGGDNVTCSSSLHWGLLERTDCYVRAILRCKYTLTKTCQAWIRPRCFR